MHYISYASGEDEDESGESDSSAHHKSALTSKSQKKNVKIETFFLIWVTLP